MEAALSKKAKVLKWLEKHPIDSWGQCIHCQSPLFFQGNRLTCQAKHSFDIAKQGYVNFATKKLAETKYDKALFAARRQVIMETDFYLPVYEWLAQYLDKDDIKVLADAGSGEGSHLMRLQALVNRPLTMIGLDLAKEGILLSTDYNDYQVSLVADLAKMPLQSEAVDVVLSFLSPANYHEFTRILKKDGLLIKVIPNENYLKEIRDLLDSDSPYSNQAVQHAFTKHFQIVDSVNLCQTINLSEQDKEAVMQMTPLIWRLSEEEKKVYAKNLSKLTLDVTILVGRAVEH